MTVEERLEELEKQVAHYKDKEEVYDVIMHYGYLVDGNEMGELKNFMATKTPGGYVELNNSGQVPMSAFVNKDWSFIKKARGFMVNHFVTAPVITIADDRQSAKVIVTNFILEVSVHPGDQNMRVLAERSDLQYRDEMYLPGFRTRCDWICERSRFDLIKEDGEWKIFRLHTYHGFRFPVGKDPITWSMWEQQADHLAELDDFFTEMKGEKKVRTDEWEEIGDPSYFWRFTVDGKLREYVPSIPEPYKTYDPSELC